MYRNLREFQNKILLKVQLLTKCSYHNIENTAFQEKRKFSERKNTDTI